MYLIGSLKNAQVPVLAQQLRSRGLRVFDSWYAPGPEADDFLRDYERTKKLGYREAIYGYAARHIFEFDKYHLDNARCVVLLMPAGKSGHLELGYAIGQGKSGYILFDAEPERFDVMHNFATDIFFDVNKLSERLILAFKYNLAD